MSGPSNDTGKRAAILEAALGLFCAKGYDGTAVPLIARRAGVSVGTVYRYFESKESLVNALYQHWKQAMIASTYGGFPQDTSPRQQFRELWARIFAFAQEHPEALIFIELHHHAPYLDAASRGAEEQLVEPLRALIRRAQAMEEIKPLAPDLIVAMVMARSWGW